MDGRALQELNGPRNERIPVPVAKDSAEFVLQNERAVRHTLLAEHRKSASEVAVYLGEIVVEGIGTGGKGQTDVGMANEIPGLFLGVFSMPHDFRREAIVVSAPVEPGLVHTHQVDGTSASKPGGRFIEHPDHPGSRNASQKKQDLFTHLIGIGLRQRDHFRASRRDQGNGRNAPVVAVPSLRILLVIKHEGIDTAAYQVLTLEKPASPAGIPLGQTGVHNPYYPGDHGPSIAADQFNGEVVAGLDDIKPSRGTQGRDGNHGNHSIQPGFSRHGGYDLHVQAALEQTECHGSQPHDIYALGRPRWALMEYYSDSHEKYGTLSGLWPMDVAFLIPEERCGNQRMTRGGTPKKKICIVTPEFPPEAWGGLAYTAHRVAEHAAGMGLDVHIAHFMVARDAMILLDENRRTEATGGMTIHRVTVGRESLAEGQRQLWDCPHNLTLQMMYQSLEMLQIQEEFDLFHSFFLYPAGYVTGLLARRRRIPHVVALVGNDVKRYIFSPEKVAVCRSGLDNADQVVGLSRDLLEMADALAPIMHKARIIYNSVEIPSKAWEPTLPTAQEPFRLGCAGIFKYAKGLPYLFKAIAELCKEEDGLVLDLVGTLRESEKEVFHTMARRTGMEDRIRFRGAIPHAEIPRWLRSLDAFALPSLTEGCPNILMEAMASGLPCVATRTGANDVLMEDGVSGLLVPWGDSGSLASALEEIMAEPEFAATLGRAARKRMEFFSARRERDEWESIYREMLDF